MWISMVSVVPSLTTKGGMKSSLRCVHQAGEDPGPGGREVKDIDVNLLGCLSHIQQVGTEWDVKNVILTTKWCIPGVSWCGLLPFQCILRRMTWCCPKHELYSKANKIVSVKPAVLLRPSGKHARTAALPSCFRSWDIATVPLAGHQPLFPVHPVPFPLGQRWKQTDDKRDSCLCPYSLASAYILAISDVSLFIIFPVLWQTCLLFLSNIFYL